MLMVALHTSQELIHIFLKQTYLGDGPCYSQHIDEETKI